METIGSILLLVLWVLPLRAAETATIVVKDITPSASPVLSFTGTVDFSEEINGTKRTHKEQGRVSIRNVSGANIMGFVAVIRTIAFRGPGTLLYKHDFFFKDHGFAPQDTFDVPINRTMGEDPFNTVTLPSSVTADLKFVQFEDGTVWGDKAAAESLLAERREAAERFKQLLSIFEKEGPAAFKAALLDNKTTPHTTASAVQQGLLATYEKLGPEEAAEHMRAALRKAEERRATGKF